MKIKANMTTQEIYDYLKSIDESRSYRTIRRWLKDLPTVNDNHRPRQYDAELLSQVLLRHNITRFRRDYLTQKKDGQNSILENEMQQYISENFDQLKNDIILRFILEKLGYHFNEERLREDLKNRYLMGSLDTDILIPSEYAALMRSVNRLTKHEVDYYFRKVRSDKKK